jgi:peptidoglycan hydrolase-like protein with peptidoglycan-binding domain
MVNLMTILAVAVTTLLLWLSLGGFAAVEGKGPRPSPRLDGGDYGSYLPSVIKQAQEALEAEGFYSGETNGILDAGTIKAIGDFQAVNGLPASGALSLETRRLLLGEESSD